MAPKSTNPASQMPTVDVAQPDPVVMENALAAPQRQEIALMSGSGLGCANPADLAHRLKIVYDVSKDKPDDVPAGSWTLGANYRFVFADGAKPMPVLGFVLGTSVVYWKEWNDYVAGGPSPKTYLSREAAVADSQRVDWGVRGTPTEKPTVAPAIDIYILIERPTYTPAKKADDADAMFSWFLDGKSYALAKYTADRGAFKNAAASLTELRNQDAMLRKVPLVQGSLTTWKLAFTITSKKSVTGRSQKLCVISTAIENGERAKATDTFLQDLKEVLGSFANPTVASVDDNL